MDSIRRRSAAIESVSEWSALDQESRDLAFASHHGLEGLQRHDHAAIFKPAIALVNPHHLKWITRDLQRLAGLLLERHRQDPAEHDRFVVSFPQSAAVDHAQAAE